LIGVHCVSIAALRCLWSLTDGSLALPREFYNESGLQKVLGRMKREPLVPLGMLTPTYLPVCLPTCLLSIVLPTTGDLTAPSVLPLGCLLTVAAFTNAYRAMRKGDHNQVQRMFRARVIAQGFTVAAMVAGGLYFGAERHKERENWKMQEQEKAEEKRQKWIRELEARDDEEKELKAMINKRREKKKANGAEAARDTFRAAEAKRLEGESAPVPEDEVKNKTSAWGLGWLGRSKAPEAKEERKDGSPSEDKPGLDPSGKE
ncbi:hypothetical protein diail_8300, partial [Diaporthe ilicicola]